MSETNRSESQNPILKAENISLVVDNGGTPKNIIAGFSFDFYKGEIYNILGPSGAGKSSLLRLFNRLDEITRGKIYFNGKESSQYNPCLLRRKIGYLFQTPFLFPKTVKDNLHFVDSSLSDDKMTSMLSEVNLGPDYLLSNVDVLSVGEKQRIALARLFALKSEVILLDEPTSALDEKNSSLLLKLIKNKVSAGGIAAIIVIHDPRQVLTYNGEALLIINGKLVEHGPAKELISQPKTESGKSFLEKDSV
ncbi:MAG: ABC transporter ATP-binding protein [Candidatus Zixiibacteriota bacterium]|nr:MAG: ABC transporter ATP-binding protein [candidate division Zixibacteria bacterium]